MIKNLFVFIFFTSFFSWIIFIIDGFFISNKTVIEKVDNHLEVTKRPKRVELVFEEEIQKKASFIIKKEQNFNIKFSSKEYEKSFDKSKIEITKSLLASEKIWYFSNWVKIFFDEKKWERRGKMIKDTVVVFKGEELGNDEFISLMIHELSHFIDVNYLWSETNSFKDLSWNSTKIIKKWQTEKDFVSGYSMSNKYEDFAESLTFYVLHNELFYKKAKKSETLMKKYSFFKNKMFNKDFKNTKFTLSQNDENKKYHWDTTKINIDEKNFLNYIKNV